MSLTYDQYLSNSSYKAENQAKRDFGADLMLAFKIKNISEGIQWYQAVHMHARFRSWDVYLPEALGGTVETVDLLNMILAGDIETACLSAIYGVPDDMSSPVHWISEDRMQWAIAQMKAWLGWP
jgi:hypothetical protein